MRPSKALEVQEDRLRVLNLGEMNRNLARLIQLQRRLYGESSRTLTRSACGGTEQVGRLAWLDRWHLNHLFYGFNPENRRHLHGVGIRRSGRSLAQQEGYVVGSTPEGHGRRLGVNDDGNRLDDLLFADMIAQQRVGIVQNGLRNGAGGDKAGQVLRDPCRFCVSGGLAGELDPVRGVSDSERCDVYGVYLRRSVDGDKGALSLDGSPVRD